MNQKIIKIVLICTITLSGNFTLFSQDFLTGLRKNSAVVKLSNDSIHPKSIKNSEAIKLPFVDDFSDYTGYPNPELWMDKRAFINNTFPILPPTIGVATLDALDENGKIYVHASSSPFAADELTSRPIRLDSNFVTNRPMRLQDSIYLSFYYQPGGGCPSYPSIPWEIIGNQPETNDKLCLDFGYATGEIHFTGYEYSEFVADSTYYAGDSIPNPFLNGLYYIFESVVFPGEIVLMPSDSIFEEERIWNEVWSTNGALWNTWFIEDPAKRNYFKQVRILIDSVIYLRDNFQFRFRNYASLEDDGMDGWASNVDQWHIDYVRLMIQPAVYPLDVAFVAPTTSFLKKYQAMPWWQFRPSDMADSMHNQLSNLSAATQNTQYTFSVLKEGETTPLYEYITNNFNAEPYKDYGLHSYKNHAFPNIDFTLPHDSQDSALFYITHVFKLHGASGGADARHENDTFVYAQKFYNYYAYDDGTAESGYSLLSNLALPEASLAVRFTLAESDTLRSIRMWFNSVLEDANFDGFTLMVWDDSGNKPGNVLYSQSAQMPRHAEEYLDFVDYLLEEPLAISGTFYVGFLQNHKTQLNIGFDQNTDSRELFMYKVANDWSSSFLKGTPMIRPVLGKHFDISHTPTVHKPAVSLIVYPNPTYGDLRFSLSGDETVTANRVMIFDMYGRTLLNREISSLDESISIASFSSGIYLVRLLSGNNIISTAKVIKQ